MASRVGAKDDHSFEASYWRVFEQFFGPRNSSIVKAMLLAKYPRADTGTGELDRVCYGLRQTMAWLAEAIEKKALTEAGLKPPEGPVAPSPGRPRRVSGRKTSQPPGSPSSR